MHNLKLKSDAACKRVLSIKGIAAYILKDSLEEFSDCTLTEVMDNLNKDASSRTVQSLNSEDLTKPDAKIVYDVLCKVMSPDQKEMFVNFEPQGKINSDGSILYRVIYVMARMIMRQKNENDGFRNSQFKQMKKCASIWIVLEPPIRLRGAQIDTNDNWFQVRKGEFPIQKDVQNMQRATVMCLTDEIDVNDKSALMMLSVLFNDRMSIQDRVLCLRKHYGILLTEEEENEVKSMSETWAGFYGRGVRYGVEQGIEQGKVLGIEQGKEIGIKEGKVIGIEQERANVANRMLMYGMDEELIVKLTGLSWEEMNKLKIKLTADI